MLRSPHRWGRAALILLAFAVLHAPGPSAFGQRASQPATAQDTAALDLAALLRQVRSANPDLAAARLGAAALATRPDQASALPDPTVAVTVQPYPVVTALGAQRTQWRVEQPIPFPGKRALRGAIAESGAEIAGYEADALAADLALDVQQAYYALYQAQQQAQLIRRFQDGLRDFEQAATAQYEVGRGPQQAILKAQIERGRLDVRLEQLAADAQSARAALARLADLPADRVQGRAVVRDAPSEASADRLVTRALDRRPEAAALRAAQQRAEEQVALAKRAFWPDVTIGAAYFDIAARDAPPTADGRDALAFSLGVKVPLWRGRLSANLDEARLAAQQANARYAALETALRTQIGDLAAQLQRQRAQLRRLRQTLIPQAETTREATLSAYSANRTDFLDLLDAERTLFSLRMDAISTQARTLRTAAALRRAAGFDVQ